MLSADENSEADVPRGKSLLEKIKSWDEAMQWSERYVKAQGDHPSEEWSLDAAGAFD